ncbi:MAG TPA: hypothetical protein VFW35_02530 [Sphingomicrobium sp.]|nr:hypothetical protein [Sphingomicrobium sp.]
MSDKSFSNELERALARPDAEELIRQIDVYIEYDRKGGGEWPDEISDDLSEVLESGDDPDKALAYLMFAAARTDNPKFLAFMAAGPLENALHDPSYEFLERIVAEARKSARFRWLISVPYKVAIAKSAWEAIKEFRITGDHEEPMGESLPERPWTNSDVVD